MVAVTGTSGNDFIHVAGDGLTPPAGTTDIPQATNANDTISPLGGDDIVYAGGGDDNIKFTGQFTAADQLDGQAGTNDRVTLNGDYTGVKAVVFNANTMVNIEKLILSDAHDYDLTINDGNVAAGKSLTVDASLLTGTSHLLFNGSAEMDGTFAFFGGAGDDQLTGGAKNDTFDLILAGNDTAAGGAGSDTFTMANTMTATDSIDGGAATDTVALSGDYSGAAGIVFGATTMTNVEKMTLANGFEYDLTTNDATVASGKILTIDASALNAGAHLLFDGSAETDGSFSLIGGQANDVLTGGAKADTFDLTGGGFEIAHGGGGADTFLMGGTLASSDQIDGGAGNDTLVLNGDYPGVGVVFGLATIQSIENIQLTAGHVYGLAFSSDATIAAGKTLTIDGSSLGSTDKINLQAGNETDGAYIIHGGAANDVIYFNTLPTLATTVDGGDGNDQVHMQGFDGSSVFFNDNTMTNVEMLVIHGSGTQNYTLSENTIAAGQSLTINRFGDGTSNCGVSIDASADTDGKIIFYGNIGNDSVLGTSGNDTLTGNAGHDSLSALGGDDGIFMESYLDALDQIDGGAGNDSLSLQGDYSAGLIFNDTTIKNVETITLVGGDTYKLQTADGNVASGATLKFDGHYLGATDALSIDGSLESDGHLYFVGGSGNDVLTGGAQLDTFDLSYGGEDIANGGGGDDLFHFVGNGSGLSAADQLNGGAGNDTVEIFGLGSQVNFSATTLTSVETIAIDNGNGVAALVMNDANVAAGATMAIDYGSTFAGDFLFFDGTAETNGNFIVTATSGDDDVKTGGGADTVNAGQGGGDEVMTGSGNDTINLGSSFNTADIIDGGIGTDTLSLSGNYTLNLTSSMMFNIETMSLSGRAGQAKFTITTVDANVAAGATLKVDAHSATWLDFNGVAETNGRFNIVGSAGADTVVTSTGNDRLYGGLGHDDLSSKGGNDIFEYDAVSESTGATRDLLRDFIASSDKFDMNVSVTGVDTKITSGAMNEATFSANLAAAVNNTNLAAHHAVLFAASSGDLLNHVFLVVDANGTAGFQAGADYVMEINNPGVIGTLTTANFI